MSDSLVTSIGSSNNSISNSSVSDKGISNKSMSNQSTLTTKSTSTTSDTVNTSVAVAANQVAKTVPVRGHDLEILKSIDLEIKQGESLAILGRSGSGKTTLLGILAGLDAPTRGDVVLSGQKISHLSEDERALVRAKHVGFVFQSFHLLPALTTLENVMLPLELKGKDAKELATQYLEQVGLGDRLNHFPPQLSGGEQQRVALARAFACQPDILFADEPTGNLDSATGKEIIDLLFELNSRHNTTLVMVTHDASLAERCQRCVHIDGGQLIDDGSER